jgi:hypothetical protein
MYKPGILSVPVIEQSADAYTYDKMKFVSASISIDNSKAQFDNAGDIMGNEFNLLCGFKGVEYKNYWKIAQYYIANMIFSMEKITFSLKDKRERLSYKIPFETYTAKKYPHIDDNMLNKDIQEAYGYCFGVPGVCLNSKKIYVDEEVPEGDKLDFYEFRFSSQINRVDKIEVKMSSGELPDPDNPDTPIKLEGWTVVYQSTPGPAPNDWTGWKHGVTAGDLASRKDKGIITLHYEVAKQGGKQENKINDVRMDGRFINLTTPLGIIQDIMTKYTDTQYNTKRYNKTEFETELNKISEEIGILFDKSISVYEAIEKIQSGCVIGFQFCIWRDVYTVRLDNPNREEKPDITRYDIMNIHEVEVDWNADLYGTYTDIEYAYNYGEKSGRHWIDKKYRLDILDIHRIEKEWSAESLLRKEEDAALKSDIILDDFKKLRPIVKGIKLFGEKWFDYRVYDIVYIDFSLPGEAIEKYPANIIRLMEYAAASNQVTLVQNRDTVNIAVLPLAGWGQYIPAKGQTLGVTVTLNGASIVQMIIGDGNRSLLQLSSAIPYTPDQVYELIRSEIQARQQADTALTNALTTEASTRQSADQTLQSNINAEAAARQQADSELETAMEGIKAHLSGRLDYLLERLAQWIPDDICTENGLLLLTENNKVLIEESRDAWRQEGRFEYLLERLAQWIPNDICTESGFLIVTENNKVLIEESRKTWRTMMEE